MNFNKILSNAKLTENGDLAFKSPVIGETEDDLMLDILFKTEYYSTHLDELPVLPRTMRCIKFAQFIRDPRYGLGKRDLGRRLLFNLRVNYKMILNCGRADDLFYAYTDSFKDLCDFLYEEIQVKENELVKKWMPRYSSKNKDLAIRIMNEWFKSEPNYIKRKQMYSRLIKANTTEQHLSRKETDKIIFNQVPSLASIKYANRFSRGEDTKERYHQYLEDVKAGKKEVKVSTTTPYDIYRNRYKIDADIFFGALPKISGSWIPIIDSSGSMNNPNDSYGKAMAIGHYLAKCSSVCYNAAISFSSQPRILSMDNCNNYSEEIGSLHTGDCSNTNLASVMNLLSSLKLKGEIDYPEFLVILSDMEFDEGSSTSIDYFNAINKNLGTKTKIVWWNLNSRNTTSPKMDESGNIFISGYNPMILKYLEVGFDAKAFLSKLISEYDLAYKRNYEK